jgi:hypothetical protein
MYESRKEGVKEARTKEENQGNSQRQSLSDKVRLFKKKFEEQIQRKADFGEASTLSQPSWYRLHTTDPPSHTSSLLAFPL